MAQGWVSELVSPEKTDVRISTPWSRSMMRPCQLTPQDRLEQLKPVGMACGDRLQARDRRAAQRGEEAQRQPGLEIPEAGMVLAGGAAARQFDRDGVDLARLGQIDRAGG